MTIRLFILILGLLVNEAYASASFFSDRAPLGPVGDVTQVTEVDWLALADVYIRKAGITSTNEEFWKVYLRQLNCKAEPPGEGEESLPIVQQAANALAKIESAISSETLRAPISITLRSFDENYRGFRLPKIGAEQALTVRPPKDCPAAGQAARAITVQMVSAASWYPGLYVEAARAGKLGQTPTKVTADLVFNVIGAERKEDSTDIVLSAEPVGLVVYTDLTRQRVLGSVGQVTASIAAVSEAPLEPPPPAAGTESGPQPQPATETQSAEQPVTPLEFRGLSPALPNIEPARRRWTTRKASNVRAGPGTDYDVLVTVAQGTRIESIGTAKSDTGGTWVAFKLQDGRTGFVSAGLLYNY